MVAALGGDLLVGSEGAVHLSDGATAEHLWTARDPEPPGSYMQYPSAITTIDARRFAAGGWRPNVYIFDVSGTLVALARHPSASHCVDFGAKLTVVGRYLVVAEPQGSGVWVNEWASRGLDKPPPAWKPGSSGAIYIFDAGS